MYYINKDEEDRNALRHIKDCLDAHIKMKNEKESEFLSLYEEYKSGGRGLSDTLGMEEEIRVLENYINAIAYTYDYVDLMLKIKKHH